MEKQYTLHAIHDNDEERVQEGLRKIITYFSDISCYKTESLDIIKELLDRGASVHTINKRGETPLMIACAYSNIHVVKLLLEYGSDLEKVDNENLTALWHARWTGAKNIVPSALDAVLLNDIDALMEAIDKSCDLNETESSGDTALHNAVQMRYNKMVILLLNAGFSVNIQNSCGDTALHLACVPGISSEIIEMLVKADKDIVNISNYRGAYPIMEASYSCDLKIIDILIKAGASLNVSCDNHTALWDARLANKMDIYQKLLEEGINPLLGGEFQYYVQFLFNMWCTDSEMVIKILHSNKHLKTTGFVQIASNLRYNLDYVKEFVQALSDAGIHVHFVDDSAYSDAGIDIPFIERPVQSSPYALTISFTDASEDLIFWLASQSCAIEPIVSNESDKFSLKHICRTFIRKALSETVHSKHQFDLALRQLDLPIDVMLYIKYLK
ncbi:uncharacterized protein LOC113367382 [Ctenocephalides felis]|uniref:uncharacterized protein LOC113367382 n=1 Tax=Ctenocephalides felis TaxID=7515 RepID=UPI000E6E52B4|nr:uncharacterized protein LOC113367382 [Ctenocephalides felis]